MRMHTPGLAAVVLVVMSAQVPQRFSTSTALSETLSEQSEIAIESFDVPDLPLNISHTVLRKSDKGFFLKGDFSNNSDQQIAGLSYLLVLVDANSKVQPALIRTESCKLAAYETRTITFRTPLRLKVERGARLELMLDQVLGVQSIWQVLKARQTLEAYAAGDYSLTPSVLRVPNHVDAPPRSQIY